jgi:hypothetical protein
MIHKLFFFKYKVKLEQIILFNLLDINYPDFNSIITQCCAEK